MKNKAITEGEIKILNEIFDKVDELLEYHGKHTPTMEVLEECSDIERIHMHMYLDFFGDLISDAKALKQAVEIPEEELLSLVTEDGKRTTKEVLKDLTMKAMVRMFTGS